MKFKPVQFPADSLPHKSIIEWWYFNGHLTDAAGGRYAFMDCLFKADWQRIKLPFFKLPLKRFIDSPYIYFAHSMLADIGKQKIFKEVQALSLLSRDSFARPLLYANYFDPITAGGYINCELAETEAQKFHLKTAKFDLLLKAQKKPLLESGQGLINICGRQSYYYSLTDLAIEGKINVSNKWLEVQGRGWMDHQWADLAYSKNQWTWFSLKLDNGADIMCVEYDDGLSKDYAIDLINAQGQAWHSKKVLMRRGRAAWKSQDTKAEYPLAWEITVPGQKIKLTTKAMTRDQEMIFGTINYWEGPIEVAGEMDGRPVKGLGFMELVNYPSDYNFLVLAGKDINKKIKRAVSARLKKILS